MKSRDKEIMVKKLNEVIPVLECPMCHNRQFAILDGYLVFLFRKIIEFPSFKRKRHYLRLL